MGFSDKLAPGGGGTRCCCMARLGFYVLPALWTISWEHWGAGCDNERWVNLSQSKSNPFLPSMASSDLRSQSTRGQIRIQSILGARQGACDQPTRSKWRGDCNAHANAHASASANLTNLAHKCNREESPEESSNGRGGSSFL